MFPRFPRGPRRRKALAFVAVLVASIALVAPALGSFGLLAAFGPTGEGPGTIGPHAPAIAVDADGRVYVADVKDDRIEAFANAGAPDGGWGGLDEPSGIAAAPDGTLVVADEDGVRRYAVDGTMLEVLADGDRRHEDEDEEAAGVAVARDGTVYVARPGRGRVDVLGGAALGGLEHPVAVALAPDRTAFVADPGDGRVHVFDPHGSETGAWEAGDPRGVAVAPDGTVFVTDAQGQRVLHAQADGTAIETLTGVNVPRGVATDCRGRAYVVDNSSLRVRVYGESGPPPPCEAPPEPAPAQEPPATAPEPEPVLGVRARASAVGGVILVGKPGDLRPLSGRELIPLGSTVDATAGRVKLEFQTAPGADRDKYGSLMDGEFYDGAFKIRQNATDSLVDLELLDEGKPAVAATAGARIAAARKLKVWGKARGRFRTTGRNGAATVRGTEWLTEERDAGTLFAVGEGVVEVRVFASGRRIVLHAGESFLAKPACVSRRAFRIRLRTRDGAAVRKAVVTVAGKRVKVRRGHRLTAPVDLRGLPAGRVVVRIRLVTIDGRVITGRRLYHTCRDEPLHPSQPPEL